MLVEGVIYVAGHPLLITRCTRLQGASATEMTYILSGGALNSHSLMCLIRFVKVAQVYKLSKVSSL